MFAQEFTCEPVALLSQSFAIKIEEYSFSNVWKPRSNSSKGSAYAALHEGTCLTDTEANHPLDVPVPCRFCVLREKFASFKADSIVVHSKKCCMGMRDIDRDQRNAGTMHFVRNHWRDMLVDLKFNHQVYALLNELVSIF